MKSFKKMTKTTKITIATGIAALGLTCGAALMVSGKDTQAQEMKVSEPGIEYVADSKLRVKETKEDKNKREAAEKEKQDAANKQAEEAKKAEAERLAAEQAEQQRQAEIAAQQEAERLAAEQAEQQRQAEIAAQQEAERVAAEQAERQRQAEQQRQAEIAAQQEAERLAAEKAKQAAAPAQNQGATYRISGSYVGSVGAVQGFIDSNRGTYGVCNNPGSGAGQTWFGHTDFSNGRAVGGAGMWQHSAKPGQTINANGVIYVINSVQSLPWNGSATWGIINRLGANQIMLQSCLTADSKTNTIIVATRQ